LLKVPPGNAVGGAPAGRFFVKPLVPPALLAGALSLGFALASAGGLFWPQTYARESATWAAQGWGQDAMGLFLVAPLLVWAAWGTFKGRPIPFFLLGGLLLYAAYNSLLWVFCVHFNRLFIIYCANLGLSVYGLGFWAVGWNQWRPEQGWRKPGPVLMPALFLSGTALLFLALWLKEDVPAILRGIEPADLGEAGLLTNPVHVLDLSLVLPAMFAVSILLLRRRALGYGLFAPLAFFSVLMALAIAAMMMALKARGLAPDAYGAAFCAAFAGIQLEILRRFLSSVLARP